jgi:hypothetical protein
MPPLRGGGLSRQLKSGWNKQFGGENSKTAKK